MIRWYLAGAGVLILVGLYRTVAIGRTAPRTVAEQKRDLFGDLPVKFKRTQAGNRWKLRIARKAERRRSA